MLIQSTNKRRWRGRTPINGHRTWTPDIGLGQRTADSGGVSYYYSVERLDNAGHQRRIREVKEHSIQHPDKARVATTVILERV